LLNISGIKIEKRFRIEEMLVRRSYVQTNRVLDRKDKSIALIIKVSENKEILDKELDIVIGLYP
jgi:hypothetical protein